MLSTIVEIELKYKLLMTKEQIIQKIKEQQIEFGYSDYRLAKEAKVTQSIISRLYSGEYKSPTMNTILALCKALNLKVIIKK